MSRNDQTKYFMHDYSALEGRREIPKGSVVGIETPTLTIELHERRGAIHLRGDECFAIVPESGNSVSFLSLDDRTRPSEVQDMYDSEGDRRDAARACDVLQRIASQLSDAKFTKTAADRANAMETVHGLLKTIRKVL